MRDVFNNLNFCRFGILDFVGTLASSVINSASQDRTNKNNYKIASEANMFSHNERLEAQAYNTQERLAAQAYNDALLEKTWSREDALRNEANEREDNALTRAVADAKNAGLSPLAAIQNGGASTVANVSTAQGASSVGATSHGASATVIPEVAPQVDLSSFIASRASQASLDEQARHNKATEQQAKDELAANIKINNDKLSIQSQEFQQKMSQENEQFYANLNQQDTHFWKQYFQSASQFSAELSLRKSIHYDELKEKDKQRQFDSWMNQNQQLIDCAKDMAKAIGIKVVYKPYTDIDKFNSAIDVLQNDLIKGNRNTLNSADMFAEKYMISESMASGQTDSASAQGGIGAGKSNNWFQSVPNDKSGAGGSLNGKFDFGASKTHGQNDSYSYSRSEKVVAEKIQQQYGGVIEVPILVRSYRDFQREYGYLNK